MNAEGAAKTPGLGDVEVLERETTWEGYFRDR
jgi:hypothetical protein